MFKNKFDLNVPHTYQTVLDFAKDNTSKPERFFLWLTTLPSLSNLNKIHENAVLFLLTSIIAIFLADLNGEKYKR